MEAFLEAIEDVERVHRGEGVATRDEPRGEGEVPENEVARDGRDEPTEETVAGPTVGGGTEDGGEPAEETSSPHLTEEEKVQAEKRRLLQRRLPLMSWKLDMLENSEGNTSEAASILKRTGSLEEEGQDKEAKEAPQGEQKAKEEESESEEDSGTSSSLRVRTSTNTRSTWRRQECRTSRRNEVRRKFSYDELKKRLLESTADWSCTGVKDSWTNHSRQKLNPGDALQDKVESCPARHRPSSEKARRGLALSPQRVDVIVGNN